MTNFNFEDALAGRRLPVYLLLDVSASMAGAPLQAVNQGVTLLFNELMNIPQAVETAWLSVITFDSQVRQVIPLTELIKFPAPTLQAGGSTALGAALGLLGQAIDSEVVGNMGEKKGDYKPLIFLLTDGEPTDNWQAGFQALRSRTQKKPVSMIGIACGPSANVSILQQICEVTFKMQDVTPDAIAQFFKWVSQSVKAASISAANGQAGQVNVPPPPPTLRLTI